MACSIQERVEAHFTRQDDQRRHQADITVIGRTWSTLRHPCMTFEALRIWTHRASKNCKARWPQDNAKLRNMRKVSGGKCFSSSPFHPSTPADPDWSWATFMTSSVEGSCQLTWAVAAYVFSVWTSVFLRLFILGVVTPKGSPKNHRFQWRCLDKY